MHLGRELAGITLLALVCGCPVMPGTPTPVDYRREVEPTTGSKYYIYVPSYYTADRDWPLVITLHGTNPYDTYRRQIRAWDSLAEERGFIVVAPDLRSPQGVLPRVPSLWRQDLAEDERRILALLDHVGGNYRIDRGSVLLTGFSAGGYPLYYVGLRNPGRFGMLIARACNSDMGLFEHIKLTDQTRKLPIRIFWGREDPAPIDDQSWAAFKYLRVHGCYETKRKITKGGHLRQVRLAHDLWSQVLPERHRRR